MEEPNSTPSTPANSATPSPRRFLPSPATIRKTIRNLFFLLFLASTAGFVWYHPPLAAVPPGSRGVRVNRWSGALTLLPEGPALCLPVIHQLTLYSVRTQSYQPQRGRSSQGEAPFKSFEGLGLGVEANVQYALDPDRLLQIHRELPPDIARQVVEPSVDAALHRTLARYGVRDIFSGKRPAVQQDVREELTKALTPQGIVVKDVVIGNVDLPAEYRQGLEGLLSEELASEKMAYTLELKEKHIRQSELEAEASRVTREKAAQAQAQEEVIAAQAKAEAMKHVLPFKVKEIEQRKLEAEAQGAQRIKLAEADSQARRLEAAAEADSRRQLAEADAYRLEVTGKAASEQLARDSALIAANPLLIQKTLADKLSDKIQVVVAPPPREGFFAESLLATGNVVPNPGATQLARAREDGE